MRFMEFITENIKPLLKKRLLFPAVYLVIGLAHWNDLSSCLTKILLANTITVSILLTKPRILFNFDSSIMVLFFLWLGKNDTKESNKKFCPNPSEKPFLAASVGIFEFMIAFFTFYILFLGIFAILAVIRGIIRGEVNEDREIQLQEQNRGLTQEELDNLPIVKYQPETKEVNKEQGNNLQETCSICLCDFKTDENVIITPSCKHIFHDECIKDWFRNLAVCPYCRASVRSDPQTTNVQENTAVNPNPHVPTSLQDVFHSFTNDNFEIVVSVQENPSSALNSGNIGLNIISNEPEPLRQESYQHEHYKSPESNTHYRKFEMPNKSNTQGFKSFEDQE